MATRWFIFWPLLRKQTNYAAVQKRYSFCEDLHGCLSGYVLRTQKGCGYTEIDAHSQTIQSNVTGTVLCYKKRQKIRTNFFAPYFTWYSTQRIVNTLLRMVHVLKGVLFAIMFVILLARFLFIWRWRIRYGRNGEPGDELRVANSDSSEHRESRNAVSIRNWTFPNQYTVREWIACDHSTAERSRVWFYRTGSDGGARREL